VDLTVILPGFVKVRNQQGQVLQVSSRI